MRALLLLMPLMLALPAAAQLPRAELSRDGTALSLLEADGSRSPAPRLQEQVGFSDVQISEAGRYIGWIASYENCCTSYPIGLEVVVMDAQRHLRRYAPESPQAIYHWCFSTDQREVIFAYGPVHFAQTITVERHRIIDGQRTARYFATDDGRHRTPPAWARCALEPR